MLVLDPTHPLLAGLTSPLNSLGGTFAYRISNPDKIRLVDVIDFDVDIVTYRPIGAGYAIYIAFDYFAYNDNLARIMANAVKFDEQVFADIELSPLQDTIHVSYTHTNSNGCINVATDSVYVNSQAFPDFNVSGYCIVDSIDFTDLTIPTPDGLSSWIWTVDDSTYTTQNSSHQFTSEGNYSIKAKIGDVIVFSFVGMKSLEKTVRSYNNLSVIMKTDNLLDEIIVVAYGEKRREAITGSVQVVDAGIIEAQQVTSPLRALQGSVAGVNLITSGGQPGSNPTINIRGVGSLNSSTQPLIVLDGAPYSGNLNAISQDQIESISVLKDASSASLYGSRAANGVILITTKRGKRNTATKVSIRSQYGISNQAVGIHDLVNQRDNMKLSWQAIRNNNQYTLGQTSAVAATNASNQLIPTLGYNPFSVNNPIDNSGNLVGGANLLWNTKWEDVLLRENVQRVNHSLNVSGGSENSNYSLSLDYLNEEGPVIISDFERISLRAAIDTDVNDWFKVGVTSGYSRSYSNNPPKLLS